MKAIILLSLFLGSCIVNASPNPQIRTCRTHNADFWALDITEPKQDNIGFCVYDEALVGSITMMEYYHHQDKSLALAAFYQTQTISFSSCADAGAIKIAGTDSNEQAYELCLFSDYSFIEKGTLLDGWFASSNSKFTSNL